jgi:alcohol dehydrogenase (cytochrome c)
MIRVSAILTPALAFVAALTVAGPALHAQKGPLAESWPTYNGDYSGRRFSTLTKINDKNVGSLTQAWTFRIESGDPGGNNPTGTPLMVDGVLYISTQDHAFAIDAHTGKQIWHYTWQSKGARHFSNRGMGMFGNFVYFETPDCNLVALNKTDGKLRWAKVIADIDQMYYCSVAPVVVGNHVISGVSGDDLDIAGYIEAHDPETGALQWRFFTVPQKKGDTGMETWPNVDMASHGGGMTWQPITYDPDTELIYVTTGNPQPVIANVNRKGDNLFTASVVAVHADTGKLAWWFQTSPHDTHDWDATQAPVLFDGTIAGQPRKLLAIAARNGHFFVLDRVTGKAYVHTEYVKTNWSLGYDAKGQPIPNPDMFPSISGALVSPNQGGATNWYPPTFSPQTGLFYVSANHAFSVYYIYDDSDNPQGWGGNDRGGWSESMLEAIDYQTGKIKWSHPWEGGNNSGLLSTAGNLIFTGAPGGFLEALNATTGEALWHTKLQAAVRVPPSTWELDGSQYVLVGAGDTLYAFTPAK